MITIYIPAKNAARYLREAIDSVLSQSVQDFELILINDGSTDGTLNIMKEYDWDSRVRIINFEESMGLPHCANKALQLAEGKYIMRLDADDKLEPLALLVMSNALDVRPEVGLVYPDYYKMDEDSNVGEIVRRDKIDEEWLVYDKAPHGACTMFRTDILRQLEGYNEQLSCQDGMDIWLRFVEKYKPYNINMPLFYYRKYGFHTLSYDHCKVGMERTKIKGMNVEEHEALGVIMATQKSIYPRSGSLEMLNGKRLIDYTIDVARKSSLSEVVVSTPDVHVEDYVQRVHELPVVKRPKTNSYFLNPSFVALNALRKYPEYDVACVLFANVPLRKQYHIDEAIYQKYLFNFDSVVSVTEDFAFYYRRGKTSLVPVGRHNRQIKIERESLLRENGAVYVATKDLLEKGHMVGGKIGYVVMTPEDSVKINSAYEFWLAEQIMRRDNVYSD